jgi:hypothetical protein
MIRNNFKYFLLLTSAILLLFNCSKDDNSGRKDLVGKTFDHLFFNTEQECIDAQTDPSFFINCHQELTILDLENAEIILTDIVYSAKYRVQNNQLIILSNPTTFEFQDDLIFDIVDSNTLRLLTNQTIWNERIGETVWD